MKKKEDKNSISNILFKVLLAITAIVFALILITQPKGSYSLKENKLRSNNSSDRNTFAPSHRKPEKSAPSELQWFDVFKGIGNEK